MNYTVIEAFMAKKIIATPSKYTTIVTTRPDLKDGIDAYLIEQGYENLIVE